MHADEIPIDDRLVERLIAAQFPRWAGLPIERVPSSGTDHAIYRLGDGLAVRLPRTPRVVGQVDKEQRWLPRLAPRLPLAIPTPVALGSPGEGYPYRWSVYDWLEGENADEAPPTDPREAAATLAGFVVALQGVDAAGGPPPGPDNFFRGVPLAARNSETRAALDALRDDLDVAAATAAWEAALAAPAWMGPPRWIHGDLSGTNLLVRDGRLRAVIDFGGLGVGDPACDLLVAWDLFTAETRGHFRSALPHDDAAWARGRGWALAMASIALPYYRDTHPAIVERSLRIIGEVLTDPDPSSGAR